MGCLLIGFGFERGNYFEGKFHCKWRHNKAIVALRALATGNLLSPIKIQFTDSIRDNFQFSHLCLYNYKTINYT